MAQLSEKTDRTLLDDYVRTGRESAFATLAARHQAMAFSTAYRICGNHEEAQDILQQALIVLARRAKELGEVQCIAAWLHRVVVLESQKSWRKSAKRRKREKMAASINQIATEEDPAIKEVTPILDASLNALSSKDREVLTMHYLEGLPFKDISANLGGNASAWQKRSVRALQKLADKLQRRGVKISVVTLGTFLVTPRSEAGLTPTLIQAMTKSALQQAPLQVTVLTGKTALLLTMKTGITVSLVTGFALAYGLGSTIGTSTPSQENQTKQSTQDSTKSSASASRSDHSRGLGFTVELLAKAVSAYDQEEEANALAESNLRSLMFLLPASNLEEVLTILLNTKNQDRFNPIVGAFFGRWGELDPATAYARAQEDAGPFVYWAMQAAMLTWLNQEPEEALTEILTHKNQQNRNFLSQFLRYQCERKPHEAALLVDQVVEDWPELDGHLVNLVAKLWAQRDPLPAAEWVASSSDVKMKENLLSNLAFKVAKIRGFDGLTIANHIEDPETREKAREKAIYWWGVTTGGVSLVAGKAKPYRDISYGFPSDWTEQNIRSFSFATMVNYTANLPDLLTIANSDEQRILIYEGALRGSAWSNPANVTEAAEQLPDGFANSENGRKTLTVFIQRWSKMDPVKASTWVNSQADGPKKSLLLGALEQEGTE